MLQKTLLLYVDPTKVPVLWMALNCQKRVLSSATDLHPPWTNWFKSTSVMKIPPKKIQPWIKCWTNKWEVCTHKLCIAKSEKCNDCSGKCKQFLIECPSVLKISPSLHARDIDRITLIICLLTGNEKKKLGNHSLLHTVSITNLLTADTIQRSFQLSCYQETCRRGTSYLKARETISSWLLFNSTLSSYIYRDVRYKKM